MSTRHLARSIIMQTLFEWDLSGQHDDQIAEKLKRNTEEFGPGIEDMKFFEDLLIGLLAKRSVIDNILQKAAPEWPIDKINAVDRNILRIGLYELLFGDRTEVPPKVAINEAIELAKTFGGENSSRFINGVLGAVYKEIGEPGKEQTSKKKNEEPVDPATLPVEKKGGAVVFAEHGGTTYFALVHDIFGYWTLSKGGIADDEDEKKGTEREIEDEIGLKVKVVEKLGENEYIASHPEKGKVRKRVIYFLAQAPYKEIELKNKSGGLDDVKWFPMEEVEGLTMYDDIVRMIASAVKIISSKK